MHHHLDHLVLLIVFIFTFFYLVIAGVDFNFIKLFKKTIVIDQSIHFQLFLINILCFFIFSTFLIY